MALARRFWQKGDGTVPSGVMVRNFKTVKILPPKPTRICRNKTGFPSV